MFPQLQGLGQSRNALFYGISGWEEAQAYLSHALLAQRLEQVCRLLMSRSENEADTVGIFGGLDALKVRSCLTLFDTVLPNALFGECLQCCFGGVRDQLTVQMLRQ